VIEFVFSLLSNKGITIVLLLSFIGLMESFLKINWEDQSYSCVLYCGRIYFTFSLCSGLCNYCDVRFDRMKKVTLRL
jgi:hypothetical protein